MTSTTSTSLRVRFAIARGYTRWKLNSRVVLAKLDGENLAYWKQVGAVATDEPLTETHYEGFSQFTTLPNPADANTVREALMGMTEEEWHQFNRRLFLKFSYKDNFIYELITFALKTPPPTLAEIYCEVKGVK